MHFFSSKIRVKADSHLQKILNDLNSSPSQTAINGPHNPFHDIEESHEKNFSAVAPHSVQRIWGSSGSQPHFHLDHMGNKMAVAKPSSGDAMKESLAYQLSKHYAPGLIPMTVARNHANPLSGPPSLHSVQQYIKPEEGHSIELDDPDLHNDKDYHRIAIMDWLHSNIDRHSQNMIAGEDGRLHAIDNAMSFLGPNYQSYDKDGHVINSMMGGGAHYNLSNISKHAGYHPIPQDIRESILKADPHKLGNLFDRVNEHGVHLEKGAKEAYLDRLDTLKHHFSNPRMQTMRDLHNELYTSPHEVFQEPDWYSH